MSYLQYFRVTMSKVVNLNVGGTLYLSTQETLTKDPSSALYDMFIDDPPNCPLDKDGNYAIDGDGPSFRYILNYLRSANPNNIRSGSLCPPADFIQAQQLAFEADRYKLSHMTELIKTYISQRGFR